MTERFNLYQSGAEPEFCIRRIIKHEMIAPGVPRIYVASERDGIIRLEFTMISSVTCLREIALGLLRIADDPAANAPEHASMGMH